MTELTFDKTSPAGKRITETRLRSAELMIRLNGEREAYRLASTEERVLAVALVDLRSGASALAVVAGLAEWQAAHPQPKKRARKKAGTP